MRVINHWNNLLRNVVESPSEFTFMSLWDALGTFPLTLAPVENGVKNFSYCQEVRSSVCNIVL